jgi:hypothetical protein
MWNDPSYALKERLLQVTCYKLQASTFSDGPLFYFVTCNLERAFFCNLKRSVRYART